MSTQQQQAGEFGDTPRTDPNPALVAEAVSGTTSDSNWGRQVEPEHRQPKPAAKGASRNQART